MAKTTTLVMTEREMLVLVAALESAKREEMKDASPSAALNIAELVELRNKLRNA